MDENGEWKVAAYCGVVRGQTEREWNSAFSGHLCSSLKVLMHTGTHFSGSVNCPSGLFPGAP